jgi:hypothetical protein
MNRLRSFGNALIGLVTSAFIMPAALPVHVALFSHPPVDALWHATRIFIFAYGYYLAAICLLCGIIE